MINISDDEDVFDPANEMVRGEENEEEDISLITGNAFEKLDVYDHCLDDENP